MNDRLYIIVTGEEGRVRSLLFSKRRLRVSCLLGIILVIGLSISSYHSYGFFFSNKALTLQVDRLSQQLLSNQSLQKDLAVQVQKLQGRISTQAELFHQEKTTLLNTAVSELEERSGMIERIIDDIGIDIKIISKVSHSGGPFIAPLEDQGQELLDRADQYLDILNHLPLGRPVPGLVTSRFGRRTDPVNGKKGFHSGVDMRGKRGQDIIATADGVVSRALVNGSYGRFVEINHGNGYTTKFAHMKKILVKKGDIIRRGQRIGIVGSSGRSTGPHLHYEVCLNKKPINPSKFMRVDKLSQEIIVQKLDSQGKKHQVTRKLLAKGLPLQSPATLENEHGNFQ